jgi:hypothetical protein
MGREKMLSRCYSLSDRSWVWFRVNSVCIWLTKVSKFSKLRTITNTADSSIDTDSFHFLEAIICEFQMAFRQRQNHTTA